MSSKRPLTVGALARILAAEDPKKLIVLAGRDICQTGFTYAPAHSVSSTLAYDAKTHEVGIAELTPQAAKLGFTQEDVLRHRGKAAVIISP